MVSGKNLLQGFHAYEKPHEIKLAGDCDLIYAVGEGNVKTIKFECGEMIVNLMNVLFVPDLGGNLLSVHSMTMHGANVIFFQRSLQDISKWQDLSHWSKV